MAEEYNLRSISMPAISSGIFGFPKHRCAQILLRTSMEFLKEESTTLDTIVMCNYDDETYKIFIEEEKKILGCDQ